jgi:hypothetical protein
MPFAAAAEFSRDPQGGNPLGIREHRHASRLEPRGVARFLVLAREAQPGIRINPFVEL